MTHYPFPGLQVVHRSTSSTFPRNLPGISCNDNVSIVKDLTPAARTSTSLPAHGNLLSCVPRTGVGPAIWSSHMQSSIRWAGEPDKPFMLVHSDPDPKTMPALCYSGHRKGGTTHQHHHRLSSHPIPSTSKTTRGTAATSRSGSNFLESTARAVHTVSDSQILCPCNLESTAQRGVAELV